MHTTTTPTAALPGGRSPLRARNAAIAALGIVSAVMVAAGVALGGGKPMPHAPATTAGAPALPAHLHEHSPAASSEQVTEMAPHAQLRDRPGTGQPPTLRP